MALVPIAPTRSSRVAETELITRLSSLKHELLRGRVYPLITVAPAAYFGILVEVEMRAYPYFTAINLNPQT